MFLSDLYMLDYADEVPPVVSNSTQSLEQLQCSFVGG